MPPLLRRKTILPALFTLSLGLALSGCSLWGASQAAVSLLPVVTGSGEDTADTASPRDPFENLVTDEGSAWSRDVLLPDGSPFDPARHRPGDRVRVRWTIPVEVGPGVEAVASLAPRDCRAGQAAPGDWRLSRSAGAAGGEGWRVSRKHGAGISTSGGRFELGVVRAEALGSRLHTPARQRVTWLLVAPSPGRYNLVVTWDGADPEAVVNAHPCIDHWVKVPLAVAMEATDQAGVATSRSGGVDYGAEPRTWTRTGRGASTSGQGRDTTSERQADEGVNTSDEGVSLTPSSPDSGTDRPAEAPDPVPSAPSSTPSEVARQLGLLDTPGYDLVRLHQEALTYEVSRQRSRAFPPDRIEALRTLRQQRLSALAQATSDATERALCQLARKPGLADRPLKLWRDTSTVPEQMVRSCRTGGA